MRIIIVMSMILFSCGTDEPVLDMMSDFIVQRVYDTYERKQQYEEVEPIEVPGNWQPIEIPKQNHDPWDRFIPPPRIPEPPCIICKEKANGKAKHELRR